MNRTFRSYINRDIIQNPRLWSEAQGVSRNVLEFPTNYPGLQTLLFFVIGNADKARALNWVTGEGMMAASKGREKLLVMVRAEAEKYNRTVPLYVGTGTYDNSQTRKVVGEMARSPERLVGREQDDDEITAHDLFSPEAYKRIPILNDIRIGGQTITDYYLDHFEPTVMTIVNESDEKLRSQRYDLSEIYDMATIYGLPPFEFGGFNGYMQFIEKGDWLENVEKRNVIKHNDQYGPDLRPEKKLDKKTGEWVDVEDTESFDQLGRPIYHFHGGSMSPSINSAALTISRMKAELAKVGRAIENGNPIEDEDPQEIERWKQILTAKQYVEKIEKDVDEGGLGRGGLASKASFPDYSKEVDRNPMPPNVDPDQFLDIVRAGLDRPFKFKKGAFQNPNAFGPEVEDPNNPQTDDGWWHQDDKWFTFKLNKQQQQDFMQFVFGDLERTGNINSKFRANQIPSIKAAGPKQSANKKASKDSTDVKFSLSPVLTNAINFDENILRGLKMLTYSISGLNPKKYTYEQEDLRKEVDPINPYDPIISTLRDNGYKWELRDEISKKEGHPFVALFKNMPNAPTTGFLNNRKTRYKVSYDEKTKKFYINIPTNRNGKSVSPPEFSKVGATLLKGNKKIRHGGGNLGGHIDANPVGQERWGDIERRLLAGYKGGLGEYETNNGKITNAGPFTDVTQLPSVRYGIQQAKKNFDNQHSSSDWFKIHGNVASHQKPSNHFEDAELLAWAVQALPLFANDPAFQLGLISQEEIDRYIGKRNSKKKWNIDDEGARQREGETKKGKGLYALMLRYGVLDGDESDEEARSLVMDWLAKNRGSAEDGYIIDALRGIDSSVADAFAHNAKEFRARKIGQFVLNNMNKSIKPLMAQSAISMDGGNDDGEGGMDFDGSSHSDSRGEYEIDQKGNISPEELAKQAGIEFPAPDPIRKRSHTRAAVPRTTVPFGNQTPSMPPTSPQVAQQYNQAASQSMAQNRPQAAVGQPAMQATQQSTGFDDFDSLFGDQPAATYNPQKRNTDDMDFDSLFESLHREGNENLLNYFRKVYKEMTGTSVIATNQTPKDGDGWNWWGAPGRTGGTSISGEANTAKIDPTGSRRGRNGSRRKRAK